MLERTNKKTVFVCGECSAKSVQWSGQCVHCGTWNSLSEVLVDKGSERKQDRLSRSPVSQLNTIPKLVLTRFPTNIGELDRVLGGGVVPGSIILLGGDPGIGKSTLALQWLGSQSSELQTLYVSGEESLQQVSIRAERLGLDDLSIDVIAETNLESIVDLLPKYEMVVIDSIQSLCSDDISSTPGSVGQVRQVAEKLTKSGKANSCSVLFIGHVTKEGSLAGPKILEHMVDTVLYFEGDNTSRFRLVRSFKNRFGSVNEVGVFVMTENGLREAKNPSALFLSGREREATGSVVLVTQEGTRPLLVEVQGLLDQTSFVNPRRLCVGLDSQRLVLLLAILQRHGGVVVSGHDVFVNVAGGIRIGESAADVAIAAAILSSLLDKPFPTDTVCFGEIGLVGEVRPVPRGQERLKEAAKLGFSRAIIPTGNRIPDKIEGLEIIQIKRIENLVSWLS